MATKDPMVVGRIEIKKGQEGAGVYLSDGTSLIDKDGNVDAPVTSTNLTLSGTLSVTGASTFTGAVGAASSITLGAGADLIGSATSDITINTDKFTVAGATGNTVIAGTCAITGAVTLTGAVGAASSITLGAGADLIGSSTSDITINTDKFTVAGATGNTVIAGTLSVTGASTLTGNITCGGALIQSATTAPIPGAININKQVTDIITSGTGDAFTLADGTAGQRITLLYVGEGAGTDTAVITPTTLAGGTTITLNAIGDSADLVYSGIAGWCVVGLGGTAAVA